MKITLAWTAVVGTCLVLSSAGMPHVGDDRAGSRTAAAPPAAEEKKPDDDPRPGGRRRSWRRFLAPGVNAKNHASVKAAFGDMVASAAPATVRILADGEAAALGAVVQSNGYILSKASLLSGKLTCKLADGRELDARIVASQEENDLALLKVDADDLTPVSWRTGDPPLPGSWVATVGQGEGPLAIGVISTGPRRIRGSRRPRSARGLLGVTLQEANSGPRIATVMKESGAERAGLKIGDVVRSIGPKAITSVRQMVDTVGSHPPGTTISLVVARQGKKLKISATLGKPSEGSPFSRSPEDAWGGGPFSERRYGFPLALSHDMAVDPHDCGGPVVDTDGKVVGINIARALRVTTYAIPADVARQALADLKKAERTARIVEAARPLDPAGIDGTLLICGGGEIPDAVVAEFCDLAGGKEARIVVIATDNVEAGNVEADEVDAGKLLQPWRRRGAAVVELWRGLVQDPAKDAKFVESLSKATAVWLVGDDSRPAAMAAGGALLQQQLRRLLGRGGVIGGTSAGAALLSTLTLSADGPDATAAAGFALLPGSVIQPHYEEERRRPPLADAIGKHPSLVGFGVDEATALVVRGRRLRVLGDFQVTIQLGASKTRPAKTSVLRSGGSADLTALRRAALARSLPPPPALRPEAPQLESGSLVIVGGGKIPRDLIERFMELAGGPDALIVVLPTAAPDPIPERLRAVDMFREAGAKNIEVLRGRRRSEVESPDFLDVLREAKGIWFGGGRQWRFVDAYLDTKAHQAFRGVLGRGGVIGGSSAGASIQADYLVRGNPLGNHQMMAEGYERGLGFLRGVAIDQHFSQRDRLGDMTSLLDVYPQLLGIGIDEATAIVVQGHVAEVVGRNSVLFYDRSQPVEEGAPDHEVVEPGSRYDLQQRKILP